MDTITRTYGPLTAVFSDEGQVSPNESDDIQINCQLRLPQSDDNFYLREDLRFGERVKLQISPLHYDWGNADDTHRHKDRSFSASTYQQVISKADKWVKDEAEKLLTAIDARKRSLVLAGTFPWRPE
jgi:hypothetical protein